MLKKRVELINDGIVKALKHEIEKRRDKTV